MVIIIGNEQETLVKEYGQFIVSLMGYKKTKSYKRAVYGSN